MKSNTLQNIAIIALTAVVAVLVFTILPKQTPRAEGLGFNFIPAMTAATTSTSVSVLASTRLMSTSTNPDPTGTYTRAYGIVCNPNATIVYVRANADKPANITNGIPIGASAGYNVCYVLPDFYNGAVQASSTVGTVSVTVNEYVY